jgi:hypothetical protein
MGIQYRHSRRAIAGVGVNLQTHAYDRWELIDSYLTPLASDDAGTTSIAPARG